jgi:hypothetical protein
MVRGILLRAVMPINFSHSFQRLTQVPLVFDRTAVMV